MRGEVYNQTITSRVVSSDDCLPLSPFSDVCCYKPYVCCHNVKREEEVNAGVTLVVSTCDRNDLGMLFAVCVLSMRIMLCNVSETEILASRYWTVSWNITRLVFSVATCSLNLTILR